MASTTYEVRSPRRAPRGKLGLAAATSALAGLLLLVLSLARGGATPVRSSVYAGGLIHPRGLAFDRRGVLYVAEAGSGGERKLSLSAEDSFRVGSTARVSRIPRAGERETLADGLPSIYSERHGDYLGAAAVSVIGDDLYVLSATGWVEDPAFDNIIVRYGADGSRTTVLDYTQFSIANPSLARRSDPRADLPGGMPFGMVARDGKLYTTDGNLEFVQEFGADGQPLRRLLEYPLSNRVLTGISVGPDGAFYVSEMGFWPYPPGSGHVTRLTSEGQASEAVGGVTASIGAAFGPDGYLYVLEHSAPLKQARGLGRLVRVRDGAAPEPILDGLNLPTALIAGPDGALYLSDGGNRAKPGEGRILRVEVPDGSLGSVLRERLDGFGPLGFGGLGLVGLGVLGALAMRQI